MQLKDKWQRESQELKKEGEEKKDMWLQEIWQWGTKMEMKNGKICG